MDVLLIAVHWLSTSQQCSSSSFFIGKKMGVKYDTAYVNRIHSNEQQPS